MSMKILVVIVLVVCPVFSRNLNSCTNLTTTCPPAAEWTKRSKIFDCPGNKRYICLMSPGYQLREGCIFNYTISAGQTGCPYTDQCDPETDQPALVLPEKYLTCPPDTTGCPPTNHSGYSILDIYKYPLCHERNQFDKRFGPTDKVSNTTTLSTKDTIKVMQEIYDEKCELSAECILSIGIPFIINIALVIFHCILAIKVGRKAHRCETLKQSAKQYLQKARRTLNYLELRVTPRQEEEIDEKSEGRGTKTAAGSQEMTLLIDKQTGYRMSDVTSNQEGEDENEKSEGSPLIKTTVSNLYNCSTKRDAEPCKGTVKYICAFLKCETLFLCKLCCKKHTETHADHPAQPLHDNRIRCKKHDIDTSKYDLKCLCMQCKEFLCHQCSNDHLRHPLYLFLAKQP